MTKRNNRKVVGAQLGREQLAELERIKVFHGIERNSDLLRKLIRQEAQRIAHLPAEASPLEEAPCPN